MPRFIIIFGCMFGLSCKQAAQENGGAPSLDTSSLDSQARGDSGQSDSSAKAPNGIGFDSFDSGEIVSFEALGKDWRFFRGEGWAKCSLPIPPGFAVEARAGTVMLTQPRENSSVVFRCERVHAASDATFEGKWEDQLKNVPNRSIRRVGKVRGVLYRGMLKRPKGLPRRFVLETSLGIPWSDRESGGLVFVVALEANEKDPGLALAQDQYFKLLPFVEVVNSSFSR